MRSIHWSSVLILTATAIVACTNPSPVSDFGTPSVSKPPTQAVPKTEDVVGTYAKVAKADATSTRTGKQAAANPGFGSMDVLNAAFAGFAVSADGSCPTPVDTTPMIMTGEGPGQLFLFNFLPFSPETQSAFALYDGGKGSFTITDPQNNINCTGKAAFADGDSTQIVQVTITCTGPDVKAGDPPAAASPAKSSTNPSNTPTCESLFQKTAL